MHLPPIFFAATSTVLLATLSPSVTTITLRFSFLTPLSVYLKNSQPMQIVFLSCANG